MPMTVRYEVIRKFKYGGGYLEPGDEFVPGKGKWDETLIADESKYIRRVEMKPMPKKRARGATKKVTNE